VSSQGECLKRLGVLRVWCVATSVSCFSRCPLPLVLLGVVFSSRGLFWFSSIFFPSYSRLRPVTLWSVGQVGAVSDPTTLGVLRLSTAVRSAILFFQNRRTIGRAFQRIHWLDVAGMSDLKCIQVVKCVQPNVLTAKLLVTRIFEFYIVVVFWHHRLSACARVHVSVFCWEVHITGIVQETPRVEVG